ncbi:MAG: rhodanese-like domain-containing protein, partial [Chitinophagaceae bacterium]
PFFLIFLFFLNTGILNARDTTGKAISESAFAKKMQLRKIIILDVRRADEYKEGHLKNAINFNVMDSLSFDSQLRALKKNRKYLLYCRSSVRSGKALVTMQKKGFKHLWHLSGGISAWSGEIEKPILQ